MKLIEILQNELLDLPKSRNGQWFPDYIEKILFDYIELTNGVEEYNFDYKVSSKEIHDLIVKLSLGLIRSVKSYYSGHPFEAYESIAELLQHKTNLNNNIILKILKPVFVRELKKLYRIRAANPNDNFSKQEMFHVPFNLREKNVKTQRYSIPGYPCLYLSNSVFVTWEELKRPDLNKIHAVRFEPSDNNNIMLLDLQHPNELRKKYNKTEPDTNLLDYIITWPLIFLCSIKTEEKDNSFKPEYIIPQILLQYLRRNESFYGIKYFSNNIDYSEQNVGKFYNVAIPSFDMKESGYCIQMQRAFKMTESISIQKYESALGGQNGMFLAGESYNNEIREIEIIKGKPLSYGFSMFHEIEKQLTFLEANEIEF